MALTPQLTHYDFSQYTIALGPILLDGFAEGEAIKLVPATESYRMMVGVDGKVARSKILNVTAKLEINLLQTSAANDLLCGLMIADRAAPNGAGVVPMLVRDRLGRAKYAAAEAWIEKAPDVTLAEEPTPRQWIIGIAKLERFDGGQ